MPGMTEYTGKKIIKCKILLSLVEFSKCRRTVYTIDTVYATVA